MGDPSTSAVATWKKRRPSSSGDEGNGDGFNPLNPGCRPSLSEAVTWTNPHRTSGDEENDVILGPLNPDHNVNPEPSTSTTATWTRSRNEAVLDRSNSSPPVHAINIGSVVAEDSTLHFGTNNTINLTQVMVYPSDGKSDDIDIVKSNLKNTKDMIEHVLKRDLSHTEVPLTFGNRNVLTGFRDLQTRWYYWIAGLVALSSVACVVAAVAYNVHNFWLSSTEQESSAILESLQTGLWFLLLPLVALSCMNLVSTAIISLSRARGDPQPVIEQPSDRPRHQILDEDSVLIEHLPCGLKLMKREFWCARLPTEPLHDNLLPVPVVVLCHTATRSPSETGDIALIVNSFQRFHIEGFKRLADISYNFLIGADGNVYEGRGWGKVPAHTRGKNHGTLAIAIIGNFMIQMPSDIQLDVLHKFLDWGVLIDNISLNYKLVAHCQMQTTGSPGLALMDEMVTWPHFDNSLPINCASD